MSRIVPRLHSAATAIAALLASATVAHATSTLQFSASAYSAGEGDGTVLITVTRVGASSGTVGVNYQSLGGGATLGADYTLPPGQLTWADGDYAPKTFVVTLLEDATVEPDETINLSLTATSGDAQLGTPSVASFTIRDDDVGVSFAGSSSSQTEGAPCVLYVSRLGSSVGAVSVAYDTRDSTATAGVDYAAQSGILTWLDGDASQRTISVASVLDSLTEGTERYTVTLHDASPGVQLLSPSTTVVSILDNASVPMVQFSAAIFQTPESTATAMVTVSLSGTHGGTVSVTYATGDSTATAGLDYTSASGTLAWPPGDTAPRTFGVPILADAVPEGPEYALLTLSSPSPGLALGPQSRARLRIDDNAPTVQFGAASYECLESVGSQLVTVTRSGDPAQSVSVDYATVAGTALPALDFTATSGTLSWPASDTTPRTIAVPVLDDAIVEGQESFSLTLSGPSANLALGTPSTAQIVIDDNDSPTPLSSCIPPPLARRYQPARAARAARSIAPVSVSLPPAPVHGAAASSRHQLTTVSADTFVFGPWTFDHGCDGWTDDDSTTNKSAQAALIDLATLPGSKGNGALFTGHVCWIGQRGTNACMTKACYPGYDNGTNQIVFRTFPVSAGTSVSYAFRCDAEPGYDHAYLFATTAAPPALLANGAYDVDFTLCDTLDTVTGAVEGTHTFDLSAYATAGSVTLLFVAQSDGAYSDGDCGYNSTDGLFECDNVQVGPDLTTWDSGANGWTFGSVQGVGTFAKIEPVSGLPNADPCPASCGLAGNVVTMYDSSDPCFHTAQNEAILSPVLDLTSNPRYPASTYLLQFDVYANMPLQNGTYYYWQVRYSPVEKGDCSCLDPNDWSAWLNPSGLFYGGGLPTCSTGLQFDMSSVIPAHAQRVQVGIGVVNYVIYSNLSCSNQSPYFDNVSVRAAGGGAPGVALQPWEFLQDAYPNASSFSVAKSTPAKMDEGLNIYANRVRTRLGDSTTCSVALSCNADERVEVDYLLKVTPGPCLNRSHPWWVAYSAQPKIASGPYAGFAVARADTAQASPAGPPSASVGRATFMSAFHESPPATGTLYAGLGDWSAYTGGGENLSIFPDDLFTPGTHIEYAIHSTYIPGKGDAYAPDPAHGNGDGDRAGNLMGNEGWLSAGGTYDPTAPFVEEASVLPLTTRDGTSDCANAQPAHCFLYVDRAEGRGAQPPIENGFRNLGVTWDRYDVRAPTSSQGNDLGTRYDPLNFALGDHAPGPLPSLLTEVYNTILWNTGTLNTTNFSRGSTANGADAGNAVGLLDQWLRTGSGKSLWVSGDGNARFLNATGNRLTFLNTTLGVTYLGPQYRDVNTAWGVTLTGLTGQCGAGLSYGLRANWCPQRRSYNRIDRFSGSGLTGVAAVDVDYPAVGTTSYHAAVRNVATTGGFNFRTQTDAFSLDMLRQPGVTPANEQNAAIASWESVVLSQCFTGCFSNLGAVAIDPAAGQPRTALARPELNPVVARRVRLAYSLAVAGEASLRVYDSAGRQVATLVDGHAEAGPHEVWWEARGVAPGVYFFRLWTRDAARVEKLILLR